MSWGAICPDDNALHIWTAQGGALVFADCQLLTEREALDLRTSTETTG